MEKYQDIINTNWIETKKKSKHALQNMPFSQRAKIFLPFAALTGYETKLSQKQQEIEDSFQINGENLEDGEFLDTSCDY